MSSRSLPRLVYMANQIARELAYQQPGKVEEATADHLHRFWDPRMRELICAHLRTGGEGLSDIARGAVGRLERGERPDPRSKATEFSGAADPDLMSDAG